MKKIVLLILLVVLLVSCATIQPGEEGTTKTVVVDVPGKSREEIYSVLHEWLLRKCSSPQSAIQTANSDEGVLFVKLYAKDVVSVAVYKYDIAFNWKIDIKDNKYRLAMIDIDFPEIMEGFKGMKKEHYDQIWSWLDTQLANVQPLFSKAQDSDW